MEPNWIHEFGPSVEVELDLLCGAAVSSGRPASAPPRVSLPVSDSLENTGNGLL